MRSVVVGCALALMTACGTQGATFEHESRLDVSSRGVAVEPGGTEALVGMYGTTCVISVNDAMVGADFDFPTDSEEVQDVGTFEGDRALVVVTDLGAHLSYTDRPWDWTVDDVGDPGVLEARFVDDGIVTLYDDHLDWTSDDGNTSSTLPDDFCVGGCSMSVDRVSGNAFLANGDTVVVATPEGYESLADGADLVVWDPSVEVLYAALTGETLLRGLEVDGTARWSTDLEGGIRSLDALGSQGAAAVVLEYSGGAGGLVTVDGVTGEVTSHLPTPSPADEITVASDGSVAALTLPNEMHFFRVRGLP